MIGNFLIERNIIVKPLEILSGLGGNPFNPRCASQILVTQREIFEQRGRAILLLQESFESPSFSSWEQCSQRCPFSSCCCSPFPSSPLPKSPQCSTWRPTTTSEKFRIQAESLLPSGLNAIFHLWQQSLQHLDHMDDGDHDDQGQLEPEEHPGHRRSCSNYQLGRHHQVPVEGSQGETIKFMWRRVTCFSKLSQSSPKAGPKLSQNYKQVNCFSRWEAPLSRTTPTTWPSPRAATPSSTSPRFFKIKM